MNLEANAAGRAGPGLRLRDTLRREVLPVEPMEPGRVRLYSCGPTVYRFAHVGNLRTFLLADLIRRVLLYHGLEVLHVQNITDVGHMRADASGHEVDPMLVAAGLEGRSSREIADAYEAAFHADAAMLNLLPAHEFPRATEHIPEMLALAERLESLGHAYVSRQGNLYFDVSTYPAYGALSRNSIDELRAGHRSDVEPDKRDPADFALWKAAGPESTRDMVWPSKWGDGFPGWHLECSAMALKHLGPRFEIHTGGEDNVFPHHEDEIAQSAPVTGGPPANAWVHGAHLLMSGRKMSKSAGNFQRITELADEGFDPLAFRYLCMTSRYGRKLNLSDESLAGAAGGLASLRAELTALGPAPAEGPWAPPPVLHAGAAPDRPVGRADGVAGHGRPAGERAAGHGAAGHGAAGHRAAGDGAAGRGRSAGDGSLAGAAPDAPAPDFAITDRASSPVAPLSTAGRALHDRFVAAIDDDLDLPVALRIARESLRAHLPADERRWLVLDYDAVLGLDLHLAVPLEAAGRGAGGTNADDLPEGAVELLAARVTARAARDWREADRLRDELRALGVEVTDRADGTSDARRITA